MVRNICNNCKDKNIKGKFNFCDICSYGKGSHFEAKKDVDDRVVDEEDFQERIQELLSVLMIEKNNLYEMHKFVEDNKTYRKNTMKLVDEHMRESIRQLGFLDTYDGM